MSEYLMRDAAPLTDGEWKQLDKTVVDVARQFLVGRRFLDLAGPFGAGLEVIPVGSGENRKYISLELIEQTFTLAWREIEASRRMGTPLELGVAAQAAMACARAEDEMIFAGLLSAADKRVALSDWSKAGAPLTDVVKATEALFADGFFAPYAVLLSPSLFSETQRVSPGMGRMVGKLIGDVAGGGLFRTALLEKNQGMVLSLGAFNFDLVVGEDLVTAYQGNEGLNQGFRVLETLALRVKRGGAVCKLG